MKKIKPFPLSLQEMFDLAYNGVINQGSSSSMSIMDEDGMWSDSCVYHGENSKKCAAGHVFAAIDHKLDLSVVDKDGGDSARSLLGKMGYGIERGDQRTPFSKLLQFCQAAHDNAAAHDAHTFIKIFKLRMSEVANTFNLTIPIETQEG